MRLIYSHEAVADLLRLRAFIAAHDPAAAARVATQLIERIENLSRFPQLGHSVVQAPVPDTVRDMVFGRYIVRYSVHEDARAVLRIWHHYESRS